MQKVCLDCQRPFDSMPYGSGKPSCTLCQIERAKKRSMEHAIQVGKRFMQKRRRRY